MSVLNVLATWLSLHAEQRVDFIQEIADQELIHIGVRLSPTNLFHSLNLWCRLGPTKKRKRNCSEWVECFGHWTVLMRWTEGGLCTRDRWLKAEPRRNQNITQQISSLVLICDAKTWSHKKEEKEMYWACQMFWPLDCLFTLNRERTLYKRWLTKDDP